MKPLITTCLFPREIVERLSEKMPPEKMEVIAAVNSSFKVHWTAIIVERFLDGIKAGG